MASTNKEESSSSSAEYYKFDYGQLPDDLFDVTVPVEKWLDRCESTNDKKGFKPNSLSQDKIDPITLDVELERLLGISLYMAGNVIPFFVPLYALLYFLGGWYGRVVVMGVFGYVGFLSLVLAVIFKPHFTHKYKTTGAKNAKCRDEAIGGLQYAYTERNSGKYLSMKFIWPKSLHPPKQQDSPLIFCIVPHGVIPFGITAYPLWSKLWNAKLCRWTAAPAVIKIPIIGYFLEKIGYIPAKASSILRTLTEKQHNVGLTLDGIAGMFHQQDSKYETAYLKQRKGIVKIALKAGVPIVPVYGFGHTSLYNVVVDPFGIMEYLSNQFGVSITPFFGRFGWPLGPPQRKTVIVALGDPIPCPKTESPTQEQIDEYHSKMLQGFQTVFDTHKSAYGWPQKSLKIV